MSTGEPVTADDDASFLRGFEAAAIPLDRWHHREHIRVAFLYLREHPFEDALNRIRSGIQALNRANRVAETETSGYHETVTVAWARLVAAALQHHGPSRTFESFAAANPHLLAKSLLRVFYTREHILSPQAKAAFVEPDLTPLPAV